MASIDEIIKRELNPFESVQWRPGNFWQEQQNPDRDVDSIHLEALNETSALLDRVAADHSSRSLLFLGESGSGKSHLLGRLKRNLNDKAFFAYIGPWTDSGFIWRHTLRYIVDSLVKVPDEQKESQLLLWIKSLGVFQETSITSRKGDARKAFINKLRDIYPADIYNANEFFGVLYHLLNPKLHRLACDWLRGDELDEDDLNALGIRRAIDTEDAAQKTLENFGKISARSQPIVLCFDNLDTIPRLPSGVLDLQALFNVNTFIHNQKLKNFLVIISIVNDTWQKNANRLHPADRARLDLTISLKPITLTQAEELWVTRLYPLHQQATPQPESPIFPLTKQQLELKFPGGKANPRNALTVGQKLYQEYKDNTVISKSTKPGVDENQRYLAAFKLLWQNEFKKTEAKISRIRDLASHELMKRLEEVLKALQVAKITPNFLVASKYASYSLQYQHQPRTSAETVGVVWIEEPNMTRFSHFMSACELAVNEEKLCQTLYLIRAESIGTPKNKGYQIYQQLFTDSPHRHITPSLSSVHYLATYYNMVNAATSGELVVADKTPSTSALQLLIRQSQVLKDCLLLQDLGIVPSDRKPDDEKNGKVSPLKSVKESLLNIVITQQLMGLHTLVQNTRSKFPDVDASVMGELIQELCQENKIKILDPNAQPEEQLVCLLSHNKKASMRS